MLSKLFCILLFALEVSSCIPIFVVVSNLSSKRNNHNEHKHALTDGYLQVFLFLLLSHINHPGSLRRGLQPTNRILGVAVMLSCV